MVKLPVLYWNKAVNLGKAEMALELEELHLLPKNVVFILAARPSAQMVWIHELAQVPGAISSHPCGIWPQPAMWRGLNQNGWKLADLKSCPPEHVSMGKVSPLFLTPFSPFPQRCLSVVLKRLAPGAAF